MTKPTVEHFRKDYAPLPFDVSKVEMDFSIRPRETTVHTRMTLVPNPKAVKSSTLFLNGDPTCVTLKEIKMEGKTLSADTDYKLKEGDGMELLNIPDVGAVVETTVTIIPEDNTELTGLYQSGDKLYCTQCEAEGFRRITYYPDRPDVMAVFERVRIEANQKEYPVLLSNGNCADKGTVGDRHFTVWSDPFPKPSYLFAAVAGDLDSIQSSFTTKSGRNVDLRIYSEPKNVHKLEYAMDSLKRSMKWDEDRFGLEYDLDLFNIVAVESFNMGAMENKSLNIFNTALVCADSKSATDLDFERVEGVVAHEYFHNWTGNRVTCRDWFQLTLKEGLTVFRDQEFSADMISKPVVRIENVKVVRGHQFNEDAGPMSHPIRPESYQVMDNFYTSTVYRKGAEVIRMYQTLLTVDGFNKGMKLYFERHDGSAVTCDDFLVAMADANSVDLSQFALWYSTPGTPIVKYTTNYSNGTFSVTFSQSSKSDKPLHIPISVGLLDKATGKEVVPTKVLELKEMNQTFTFDGLSGKVVPSMLRDFSAPIKLIPESDVGAEEAVAFLAAHDTDGFNRWDASQKLFTSLVLQRLKGQVSEKTAESVHDSFRRALMDENTKDYSIQAFTLTLPTTMTLVEEMTGVLDPIGVYHAREAIKKEIARRHEKELRARYEKLTAVMKENPVYKVEAMSNGRRRLRNTLLDYLCSLQDTPEEQESSAALATQHFESATNMTDKQAGFVALASMTGKGAEARDKAVQKFYDDAEGDALVLDKWFMIQALSDLPDVLDRVKALMKHKDFSLLNPNKCRSLVGAFSRNTLAFHAEDGSGYKFLADVVLELDKVNNKTSSRMAGSLIQWRRYDEKRGAHMKSQLERLGSSEISSNLSEIVSSGLKKD